MDYTLDKISSKQLLDYYVLKEYVLTDVRRGYAARVRKNLADTHAIQVKEHNVHSRVKRVLAGDSLRPSADVDGSPSLREGKDQNYAALVALVDVFLPRTQDRSYIGLPANQLDDIASRIGGSILAAERDLSRAQLLEKFKNFIEERRRNVCLNVANSDIWRLLQSISCEFNIFDLDLMCPIPEDTLEWADAIYHSARPGMCIVHVATTCGRWITQVEYEKRAHWFSRNLHSVGFKPIGCSSFSYRDRATPMRCERYVLLKQEQ